MKLDTILNPLRVLGEANSGFSLKNLISIDTPQKRAEYAYDHLKFLGKGSSRLVFEYRGFALKVAKDQRGVEQNAVEAQLSESGSPVLTEVFEVGPKNIYLIVEKANSIYSLRQLDELSSLPEFGDGYEYLTYAYDCFVLHKTTQSVLRATWGYRKEIVNNPWIIEVVKLIRQYGLDPGDLVGENLGVVNRDGTKHLVILDPGFNTQVGDEHYSYFKSDIPKPTPKSFDQ